MLGLRPSFIGWHLYVQDATKMFFLVKYTLLSIVAIAFGVTLVIVIRKRSGFAMGYVFFLFVAFWGALFSFYQVESHRSMLEEALVRWGAKIERDTQYWDPQIVGVDFSHCEGVERDHARVLGELPCLKSVSFAHTDLTDECLSEFLGGRPRLRGLNLAHTKVTDAGLTHVGQETRLEEVNLVGTQVTEAGVKMLQEALPDCCIEWDGE